MYDSFFGFNRRPFVAAPQVDSYFPAAVIESARQTLCRCIERVEGPSLLIGPVGTGKTLLCQILAEQFRETVAICLLSTSRLCSRRALLQSILFELGLPFRGIEEGELRLSLIDHLRNCDLCPQGMLLLVDEAHTLPMQLLEEIRMITNVVRDGRSCVRLVVAGSPVLEEQFATPMLESFNQRLAARCYLESFNRQETLNYVRYQVSSVGGNPEQVFDSAALQAVYDATDGIPRLTNQLCDHALVMAAVGGQTQLEAEGIQEAWSDLQQLPGPMLEEVGSAQSESRDDIIEFGGLDDEPADKPIVVEPAGNSDPPVDPSIQLDCIERHVADFGEVGAEHHSDSPPVVEEETFRPAGRIGPEDSPSITPGDPFAESFVDEEVVIDRFLPMGDGAPIRPTRVDSQEGRELSALLDTQAQDQVSSIGVGDEVNASNPEHAEASHPNRAARQTWEVLPELGSGELVAGVSDESAFPSIHDSLKGSASTESVSREIPSEPATVGDSFAAEDRSDDDDDDVDAVYPDDRDLIIVQDEPDVQVRPATGVRRQEYRQLFARLRRG